ncbi:hypothetical protein ACJD0Z_04275 [Flavobacteriaceae bacterium M23B6Z8]
MLKLEFGNKHSVFEDNSVIAKLILDILSIEEIEVLKKEILSKEEAKGLLQKLELIIEEKINNKTEYDLKEIKTLDFGLKKISLNLRDKNHKEAFFLIKSYNLIHSFTINDNCKLTIERMKDGSFVFKAPQLPRQ